jgi:hypothetical protein
MATGHRIWRWLQNEVHNKIYKQTYKRFYIYQLWAKSRIRSGNVYQLLGEANIILVSVTPITAKQITHEVVAWQGSGPPLRQTQLAQLDFWQHLLSFGRDWMWNHISNQKRIIEWIKDALTGGTAVISSNGSYRPKSNTTVSGVGWIITCTASHQVLEGSFYERSSSANSYQGELLGQMAIHVFLLAISQYFSIMEINKKICCDSKSALNKSGTLARRIQASLRPADILRVLCHM